jgi:hypothetical protein
MSTRTITVKGQKGPITEVVGGLTLAALEVFRLAWAYRLELLIAAPVIAIAVELHQVLPEPFSAIAAAAIAIGVTVGAYRHLRHPLHAASVRRSFQAAAADVGIRARTTKVQPISAGDKLKVRVRDSVPELERAAPRLATRLKVRQVLVDHDPAGDHLANVILVRRDPFDLAGALPWPHAHADELSLWSPIPVGIDEHGNPVAIDLVERNLLIGGEPGAGKSVAMSLFVATAAMDPHAKVWLLDGKRVELAAWAPVAERLVGPDIKEANEVLRELRKVMDDRYRELLDRGRRKIHFDDHLPLHVLVCDELAFYTSKDHGKEGAKFSEQLRDLVARGRAAGFIVSRRPRSRPSTVPSTSATSSASAGRRCAATLAGVRHHPRPRLGEQRR